jgi:diaminopropionate ammonia-lyase
MREIVSLSRADAACRQIIQWPGYAVSPLHRLDGLARRCKVQRLYYKDEAERFGLKSFKALGGSYAVAQQLLRIIKEKTGKSAEHVELFSGEHADLLRNVTVATATDGNHGRSVAWGAQQFGCQCVIYIHADVSAYRERKMAELGARIVRVDGNYDDSVRAVASAAAENDWVIVSDNSYPGYAEIPKDVAAGYTVMLSEIVSQLDGTIPGHVLVQGGCGGLASAVCGYFRERWGAKGPRLIVVEPEQANCLQRSALAGEMVVVDGRLESLMAGLSCGEVSLLAWEILKEGASDFVTLPEKYVASSMRTLAIGEERDPAVEAGESAVAGVGALLAIANDNEARDALGIDESSVVLALGTEGATDPDLYTKLISDSRQ